ncbi:hypothetical protein E0H35_30480 [Rhizobium leguminosarum bv. viciae]|uniref:hypothetical protein n=1 Tax=Rhizobium leguminosarum TaxID=384 RepID=UPI00103D08FC|nr:hypothetical protein [Rhizobium leguminosarum]MBY5340421.1 hypothetical protein [Rhizobium leguminosarum]NKK49321.1 hypothetical protein [Rhizobium leguminosarum bv. viciae]TBY90861.1 hypothetical protein E0H35_30480 [Rhizobium leguminosarum bv. viciae]
MQDFAVRTTTPVAVEDLSAAWDRLLADIDSRMYDTARKLLIGLHDGEPDFDAIGLSQATHLPAVRWKLLNPKSSSQRTRNSTQSKRQSLDKLSH